MRWTVQTRMLIDWQGIGIQRFKLISPVFISQVPHSQFTAIFFCKILNLKITHLGDYYFCIISVIVLQTKHSKVKNKIKYLTKFSTVHKRIVSKTCVINANELCEWGTCPLNPIR
jgi:hypothetical protein